jgi:lycopene cyclase domain-containing protein
MAAYWIIAAAPTVVVAVLSAWPAFRRRFWAGWRRWGPGLLAGGALLAVDGVMSAAAGFWEFTDTRFAPERYLNLPAAEWLFFVGAMAGVRLLWFLVEDVLAGRAGWLRAPVASPRLVGLVWTVAVAVSVTFGLIHHDRTRTVYVGALAVPLAVLLASRTAAFRLRATQAYLGIGYLLFLPMDLLMNALGSFDHAEVHRSGVDLPFGVPIEDLGYIAVVLLALRLLPGPAVGRSCLG